MQHSQEIRDQDKTQAILAVGIGRPRDYGYKDSGECVNILEWFIDKLAKTQKVEKSVIVDGLYERYYTVPEKTTVNMSDKYKKKDEKTVKKVCWLLAKGKNYSETARTLSIDRRTVKNIAVKYGFANE